MLSFLSYCPQTSTQSFSLPFLFSVFFGSDARINPLEGRQLLHHVCNASSLNKRVKVQSFLPSGLKRRLVRQKFIDVSEVVTTSIFTTMMRQASLTVRQDYTAPQPGRTCLQKHETVFTFASKAKTLPNYYWNTFISNGHVACLLRGKNRVVCFKYYSGNCHSKDWINVRCK